MTKRYLNVLTTGNIKDTVTGELIRGSGIGDLLNELHEQLETCKDANTRCCNEYSAMRRDVLRYKEEIEQLKHRLAISEKANLVTALEKENEHIKTTIKTMMENERTELGRSVLRQLWEAIQ